ncbi:MAG: tetratricopeptide repeat protein [Sedimentisphaerales bacterium]|nr:tetratricopeptide repeat protein [Sedimentisphaerales bacterium]
MAIAAENVKWTIFTGGLIMRKRAFLISMFTLVTALALYGAIALAGSTKPESKDILDQANDLRAAQKYDDAEKLYNQVKAENPGSDKALEAQKQLIHLAIDKNDQKNADSSFNQMVTEFAENTNLDEAIYEIGKDYQYSIWNTAKANEAHKYNLEHFPDTKFGMMSNVEIIRSYLRDGEKIADAEVQKWLDTYKEQPDQAIGIYQIARAYVGNNKIEKGQQLYEFAFENHSDHVYGKLSQVRYNITNKDYDAADKAADSMIALSDKDNADVQEGVRELADVYRDKNEYARAAHFYEAEIDLHKSGSGLDYDEATVPYREAIYCYINMKDIETADALIGQMQTDLAKDEKLPRANFNIGNYFLNNANDTENALKVHQYNADNYPNVMEAMWSQAAVVWYYVRHNDTEKAEAEYTKLLTNYANQETLPKEIFQIGDIYRDEKKNYDKAISLYKYQLENWPNYGEPTDTYRKLACTYIDMDDKENADLIIQQLQTNCAKDDNLARANFDIGNYFLNDANDAANALKVHKFNADNHPELMEAMWSQAALVWYYVRQGDEANADAEYTKLLDAFKKQETLPKEVFQIGDIYREEKKYDKALSLYKHQLEKWPDYGEPIDIYRKMACTYVDMNDITKADAVISDIQEKFAENDNLARTNFDIGNYFLNDANDPENALKIHAYNADNCTDQLESMWSQAAIVWYYVRAKDEGKADKAYAKLLKVFEDEKTLAKEVFQIADIYTEVGDTKKARELHNKVLNDWPESEYVFDARKGLIKADFADDKSSDAIANIDTLIADYSEKSDLDNAIFLFGEEYWNKAIEIENADTGPTFFNPIDLSSEKGKYYNNARSIWEKIITELPSSDSTPQAYHFAGEASSYLGDDFKKIEYFQKVVDSWPDYRMASHCQYMIAHTYEELRRKGLISPQEADILIRNAYKKMIKNFPNSAMVAQYRLNRFNATITANAELSDRKGDSR